MTMGVAHLGQRKQAGWAGEEPVTAGAWGFGRKRLVSSTMIVPVRELVLNGADWTTKDDVYSALFHTVGAPEWHGRNLDALADSISGGSINQVEVPYRLVIKSYDRIGPDAKAMTDRFINLVHEVAIKGCPVEIRVEGQ
jgi:RNAse (barnase) inhibitor barstar